jgi:hypothetical protein
MDWKNRLYLGLGIVLALMPFMVDLALLLRRNEYMQLVPGWRYWMATSGLLLGLLAAIPTPLFYFVLEFPGHTNGDWLMLGAARWMPEALIAGVLALVLLAFGKARVRWVGLAATFVSVAFLYVTLLGLSND